MTNELRKRDVLQGAMIAAAVTMTAKIPQQVMKQMRDGDDPWVNRGWYLDEMLRIMRSVFHVQVLKGSPEYELAKHIANLNCDTADMQRRIMADVTANQPMTHSRVMEIQKKYGIGGKS